MDLLPAKNTTKQISVTEDLKIVNSTVMGNVYNGWMETRNNQHAVHRHPNTSRKVTLPQEPEWQPTHGVKARQKMVGFGQLGENMLSVEKTRTELFVEKPGLQPPEAAPTSLSQFLRTRHGRNNEKCQEAAAVTN